MNKTIRSIVLLFAVGLAYAGQPIEFNFADLSISSLTYTTAGATREEFNANNYKILRMNSTGPATHGILYNVNINGQKIIP